MSISPTARSRGSAPPSAWSSSVSISSRT
jgi:hypothetical protein